MFGGLGGFTGFLNRSIARITFDDRIIARQAKEAREKPKHLVDGVLMGLTEMTKGVVKGVAGVYEATRVPPRLLTVLSLRFH